MDYSTTQIIKASLLLSCISLGVMYLASELPVEAQEPFPDEIETINIDSGVAMGQTASAMSLFVNGENNLFAAWIATHGHNYTQYSYFSNDTQSWQSSKQFLTTESSIHSDDGIAVISYTPPSLETNLTRLCLLMGGTDNSENIIKYSCLLDFNVNNTRNYFSSPVPLRLESFDSTGNVISIGYDIDGFISITQPTSDFSFYATMNAATIDSAGIKSAYYMRYLQCKIDEPENGSDNITIKCMLQKSYSDQNRKNPTIVAIPSDPFPKHYLFFPGKNDEIQYVQANVSGTPSFIELKDTKGNKRATNRPIATYVYNGFLYIAYKNADKDGVRFSRILVSELFNDNNIAWGHCQLEGDKDKFLVNTTTAPALIAYNEKLYIFYANMEKNDNLAYQRIDDKTPGSAACGK